jgi:hypothetical protein
MRSNTYARQPNSFVYRFIPYDKTDLKKGDNEITGIHVSDGDPSSAGILGAKLPRPFDGKCASSTRVSMVTTSRTRSFRASRRATTGESTAL